ncbi:MAG TPA: HNH endonuclease [Longimicrobium sp.]
MPTCVYCLNEKPVAEFNREHVVPQAFGVFSHNLVLSHCVCAGCNSYFSGTVDIYLARKSSEGLERYTWGLKSFGEVDKFYYGDVIVRVDAPGSAYNGALVRKVPSGILGETVIDLLPQIGFRIKGSETYLQLTEEQFTRGLWRNDPTIDLQSMRIFAPTDDSEQRLNALLAREGLDYPEQGRIGEPTGDEFAVQHISRVTDMLRRGVAKIAFNYFIAVNGPEAGLMKPFDAIRRFARRGVEPVWPLVRLVRGSRLGIVNDKGEVPVAHYVTIEPDRDRTVLLAHVSLFNWTTYQVLLTSEPPAEFREMKRGHFFNLADKTCRPLAVRPRG